MGVRLTILFIMWLAGVRDATSGQIHLDATGDDSSGTGSPTEPFRSLGRAFEASAAGDSVIVKPGVYDGSENVGLTVRHSVSILGDGPPDEIVFDNGRERFIDVRADYAGRMQISGFTIRRSSSFAIRAFVDRVVLRDMYFQECSGDGFEGEPRVCDIRARAVRMENCELTDTYFSFDVIADSVWVRDVTVDGSRGSHTPDRIAGSQYLQVNNLQLIDYATGIYLSGNRVEADSLRLVQRTERSPGGIYFYGGGTAQVTNVEADYSAISAQAVEGKRLLWFATWTNVDASNLTLRLPTGGSGTMGLSIEGVRGGLFRDIRVLGGRAIPSDWTPIAVQAHMSEVTLERFLIADLGSTDSPYLGLYLNTAMVDLVQGTTADIRGGAAIGLWKSQLSTNRVVISNPECDLAITCGSESGVDPTATNVFGHLGGNWIGCLDGLGAQDGNISEDPLFCPDTPDDYLIVSDSPCAEGNHPSGMDWGLLGFGAVGCEGVPTQRGSLGSFKGKFRTRQ